MIQRFVTTLRALATLPAAELATPAGRQLVGDCADATRLELDCPQQDLTPAQRAALRRLGDALETEPVAASDVLGAARDACAALGLQPAAAVHDSIGTGR